MAQNKSPTKPLPLLSDKQPGSILPFKVASTFGAGVYFYPFAEINNTLINYEVVNIDRLSRDLRSWENLYLAGRMQKPIRLLRDDADIRKAGYDNLVPVARSALLLRPVGLKKGDLYTVIAGLLYACDSWMTVGGDNPHKVRIIVDTLWTSCEWDGKMRVVEAEACRMAWIDVLAINRI
ncbi:hypothetical protein EYZ11_000300 [Aspergillus tanneri]|uniref:Phosphatidate cytidylyltransferase, mitochondrial n=1 Tax=Aspergillus tanneri TaxID=1220188 RepID=A0A4S3JXI5_9EURO|nr:hypothetical protein EYZ11_000300 [Aspergillus tanneri]